MRAHFASKCRLEAGILVSMFVNLCHFSCHFYLAGTVHFFSYVCQNLISP